MSKSTTEVYAVSAQFLIFGTAFVAARNQDEAVQKVKKGNVGRIDWEEHTAEVQAIEKVEVTQ